MKPYIKISIFASLFIIGISSQVQAEENILFNEETTVEEKGKFIEEEKLEVTYSIPEINLITVEKDKNGNDVTSGNETLVDSIYTSSELELVDSNEKKDVSFEDAVWQTQWDMQKFTQDKLSYSKYPASKETTIAIIDSGIDVDHPDLMNSLLPGSKNFVPAGGHNNSEPNETGNINAIDDILGHGTAVAGQITANGLVKGAAPGIGVRAYRVFGTKSAKTEWILKAIVEAAKDGADVINLSLGEYMLIKGEYSDGKNDIGEYEAYKRAINYANKQGSLVVASVGNDGVDVRNKNAMISLLESKSSDVSLSKNSKILDMPASLPNVIAVGSTGPHNERSIFSNYGSNFIDLYAPGGDFRYLEEMGQDAWINEGYFEKELVLTTANDGTYAYDAGVSYSTAKVSAALGLLIENKNLQNNPKKVQHLVQKYSVKNRNQPMDIPSLLEMK
ncbi:S8 family serine peptidase [Bacillus sp. H1a]|uniref:S8 family peptidase n=1 Tax=Bacillus sp. H1a TaxID=1397276 RepID=UPI000469CB32|nr:S8 family serine peptidase [Bacillus sp. H1a]